MYSVLCRAPCCPGLRFLLGRKEILLPTHSTRLTNSEQRQEIKSEACSFYRKARNVDFSPPIAVAQRNSAHQGASQILAMIRRKDLRLQVLCRLQAAYAQKWTRVFLSDGPIQSLESEKVTEGFCKQ